MNLPNALTVLRIILGIIVPMLILHGGLYVRILGAFLFFIAGLTDYFDGWYARKHNLVTKLGAILDPIADKIIILSCFFVLSSLTSLNVYSFWWVIPIFLREVIITIIRLAYLAREKPLVISASRSGKLKTTMHFMTLPLAYFIFMFSYYGDIQPAIWVQFLLHAFLIASISFALYSGWKFLSKNRLITGY